jgi:hypothetical protein
VIAALAGHLDFRSGWGPDTRRAVAQVVADAARVQRVRARDVDAGSVDPRGIQVGGVDAVRDVDPAQAAEVG